MTSFRKTLADASCTPPPTHTHRHIPLLCLFPRSGVWAHAFRDFPRLFICVFARAGTPQNAWRIPGALLIKSKSSGLVSGAFSHGASSPTPSMILRATSFNQSQVLA